MTFRRGLAVYLLIFAVSPSVLARAPQRSPEPPPPPVTQADIDFAEYIINELSTGGKVCRKDAVSFFGTRIMKRPCVTSEDINVEQWNGIYDDLRKLKEKYACQQRERSNPTGTACTPETSLKKQKPPPKIYQR